MELLHYFPEVLQLVQKLNEEAATETFSATGDASGAIHLDEALLSKVDDRTVLMYIEASGAPTRYQKQNATFNSRAFYLYAASHFQQQRSKHSNACKKVAI